jgi:hypothetical protein
MLVAPLELVVRHKVSSEALVQSSEAGGALVRGLVRGGGVRWLRGVLLPATSVCDFKYETFA